MSASIAEETPIAPTWDEISEIETVVRSSSRRSRPDLSRLCDAVVDGRRLFGSGDRVIVELFAESGTWLSTFEAEVEWIDDASGNVALRDPVTRRCAGTNWRAVGPLLSIKLPIR